jgi:hypothetical protein
MAHARTVDDGAYLDPNIWSAVDAGDTPCTLYVGSLVDVNSYYVVMNATKRDVKIRVEGDAFPLATIDATSTDVATIPPGSSMLAVISWSDIYNSRALVFTIVNDGSGGGGGDPTGDWLPKVDPAFTGVMTGEEYESAEGFTFSDGEELQMRLDTGSFAVEGTNSVDFNVEGRITGYANSVHFHAKDYISLQADGPEEGVELSANNGSVDVYSKTTSMRSTERTDITSQQRIEISTALGADSSLLTLYDKYVSIEILNGSNIVMDSDAASMSANAVALNAAQGVAINAADGDVYLRMDGDAISMSNSSGAEFTELTMTANSTRFGSVLSTGLAGTEVDLTGVRMVMPTGIPGGDPARVEVNADGVVISTNPILAGTLATAELPDMALVTKGQIWDILNGVYDGMKNDDLIPGPARATGQFVRLPQAIELGTPDVDMHFTALCVEQCDVSTSGGAVVVFNHLAGNRPNAVLSTGHWSFTFQAARTGGDLPTVPTWYID